MNKHLPKIESILSGCFIDFEGFASNQYQKSPPPVLIGIYREGDFKQVIFTQQYRWAAVNSGVNHTIEYCSDRSSYLSKLAESTSSIKSPMFAFSEYEKNVIEHYIGCSIKKRYKNLKPISKRFINKYPNAFLEHSSDDLKTLRGIAKKLGVQLTKKLPVGGVTSRLRDVREYSNSRVAWAKAPKEIRNKWREVLEHNKSDCECMYGILKKLLETKEILKKSKNAR